MVIDDQRVVVRWRIVGEYEKGTVVVGAKSEESLDDVNAMDDKGVIGGSDRWSARDKWGGNGCSGERVVSMVMGGYVTSAIVQSQRAE